MKSSLSYCASLIRARDYDRYICTLFAPPPVREAWFALFAFNHEIASIGEIVSEEMIGFMRFTWWREALDEIYAGGKVRKHPAVEALTETVRRCLLPRALLDAMLDARAGAMGMNVAEKPAQWEAYFYATSSTLFRLCALAAGCEPVPALDDLGIAWACVGTARVRAWEGRPDEALLTTSDMRLAGGDGIPALFAPFKDTAAFYLRRLKTGKSTDQRARLSLTFHLLRRKLFGNY